MAGNNARVRISGDGKDAARAIQLPAKEFQNLGKAGKKAADDIAEAQKRATAEEKRFEAEVQKSIERMKRKEQQARATAEAVKRVGGEGGEGDGGRAPRHRLRALPGAAGDTGAGGRERTRGVLQSLGRMGGMGGEVFGKFGESLGAATPALIGLGAAAATVGIGLKALGASMDRANQQIERSVRLETERAQAIKAGREAAGNLALQAEEAGGQRLRQILSRGVSLGGVATTAQQYGISPEQAAEMREALRGLSGEVRRELEKAFIGAERLGGSGLEAIRYARENYVESGRFLPMAGTRAAAGQDRAALLVRGGLQGAQTADYTDAQIRRALEHVELQRLESLRGYRTAADRARFSHLQSTGSFQAAREVSVRGASDIADPAGAGLRAIDERLDLELQMMRSMAEQQSTMSALMQDLRGVTGGQGSFRQQHARMRDAWGR